MAEAAGQLWVITAADLRLGGVRLHGTANTPERDSALTTRGRLGV